MYALSTVRHQHHEESRPQKICLQQIPEVPQYHQEEVEFQPEQPQHIVLNPNHAVYVSTQDEYGNLRTFKISQNSPLLQQNMLTGQELPIRQHKTVKPIVAAVEPVVEPIVETIEKRVIEEIADIKEAEVPQETPKSDTEIVQKPVQKPIYADRKKSRKGKVEQVKKPEVVIELPEETQIETPVVHFENEKVDVPTVETEEDKPEAVKTLIVEETPSEEVVEEKIELLEPKKNENQEEIVIVTVDDLKEQNIANPELEHQNETYEVVSEEEEISDEKIDDDHEIVAVSDEDELFTDHHDIEKRDVSAETLDGIEIEEEAVEQAAKQIAEEPETFKKDLSETEDEDKGESKIMETTPAPTIEEPDTTSKKVEIVEAVTLKEKNVAPVKDDFVMEIPKRRLSSRKENIAAKEKVVVKEPTSESKLPEEVEEVIKQVNKEIEHIEEDTTEKVKVIKETDEEIKEKEEEIKEKDEEIKQKEDEDKNKEDSIEKVEETESEEVSPSSDVTPAPSVEGVLPTPDDIISTTTPLPILLALE